MRFRDYALRRKSKNTGGADIQYVDDLVWGIVTILLVWGIVTILLLWQLGPLVLDFLIYGG